MTKTKLTSWFADVVNGIGDFFANRVHTKTHCVGDTVNGETCITKSQLDTLLSGQGMLATPPTISPASLSVVIDTSTTTSAISATTTDATTMAGASDPAPTTTPLVPDTLPVTTPTP